MERQALFRVHYQIQRNRRIHPAPTVDLRRWFETPHLFAAVAYVQADSPSEAFHFWLQALHWWNRLAQTETVFNAMESAEYIQEGVEFNMNSHTRSLVSDPDVLVHNPACRNILRLLLPGDILEPIGEHEHPWMLASAPTEEKADGADALCWLQLVQG